MRLHYKQSIMILRSISLVEVDQNSQHFISLSFSFKELSIVITHMQRILKK